SPWGTPTPGATLEHNNMERKPDTQEPSICVVCAWRETCVKKYSFTGQHCLEFTRDLTIKPRPEEEKSKKEER
ncbi:MAG: hypothetical protein Q8M54_09115, partial [Desulfobaccales bacterium]|nr:hypothetical protein [Desulfobaccales bacterium]